MPRKITGTKRIQVDFAFPSSQAAGAGDPGVMWPNWMQDGNWSQANSNEIMDFLEKNTGKKIGRPGGCK